MAQAEVHRSFQDILLVDHMVKKTQHPENSLVKRQILRTKDEGGKGLSQEVKQERSGYLIKVNFS